jgi:hypothetical protein
MTIKRAGKQQLAFWISNERHQTIWKKESEDCQRLKSMQRAFAAGWIAGVDWERRNRKGESK